MIRFIKRLFGITSTFFFILLIINLIDVPESDLAKDLFNNQERVALKDNGDLYLKGFQIPDANPLQYGYELYNNLGDQSFDIEQQEGLIHYVSREFVIEGEEEIWTEDEILQNIDDNKILWTRLQALMRFSHFDEDYIGHSTFRGQDFILLQELFRAYVLYLKEKGQTDLAIEMWMQNHEMLDNMLSSRQTLVFAAIVMICQGKSDEIILRLTQDYKIDSGTQLQLEQILLRPAFGERGMNLEKIYQGEHNFIFGYIGNAMQKSRAENFLTLPSPFYAQNHTRNQFAKYTHDMITLGEMSHTEFEERHNELRAKYGKDPSVFRFVYNVVGNLLLPGLFKGHELLYNRHSTTIKRRMILLALRAQQNDVSYEDMAEFIQNAPPELQNPRTGQPFDWDGAYISFLTPDRIVEIPYLN